MMIKYELWFICRYMIDDLHLLGEIVIDLKARLCYSKSKACEREIAILEEFRLSKPLCNFTEGSFAIPGKGFDNDIMHVSLK